MGQDVFNILMVCNSFSVPATGKLRYHRVLCCFLQLRKDTLPLYSASIPSHLLGSFCSYLLSLLHWQFLTTGLVSSVRKTVCLNIILLLKHPWPASSSYYPILYSFHSKTYWKCCFHSLTSYPVLSCSSWAFIPMTTEKSLIKVLKTSVWPDWIHNSQFSSY